jgi:hypothetical protein
MFVPFQSNSDELTMTADRAGVALVENMLVDDRFFDASTGTLIVNHSAPMPGIIDDWKFTTLRTQIFLDENTRNNLKKKMGLEYGNGNIYNLQITLTKSSDPDNPDKISPDGNPSGSNVGQSKRFVYILKEDPAGVYTYTMAILTVRVW